MPLIYKRFTDKTAEEWRQIYKSLQLLEFLVKNGSERVIDDARSHLGLLRMLKQFHHIDQNGKDQGLNVRNRAQELSKLLSDVDAIRAERKKSRANRNKYGGVEGGGGFGAASGNRYDGFSSEEAGYGGYQGEVYGDGGGFGGRENSSTFHDTQRRGDQFEEYDEGEDVVAPAKTMRTSRTTGASTSTRVAQKAPPKVKEPEEDLLGFDEPTSSANGKAPAISTSNDFGDFGAPVAADEDDFDDFQSASPAVSRPPAGLASLSPPPLTTSSTTSNTQFAAPKPLAAHQAPNYTNLFSTASPVPSATMTPSTSATFSSPPPQAATAPKPAPYKPTGPNYFTSVPVAAAGASTSSITSPGATSAFSSLTPQPRPTSAASSAFSAANLGKASAASQPKPAAGSTDAFSNLWSTASSKAGVQTKNAGTKGPNLAEMAKQKSSAGIWGMAGPPAGQQQQQQQKPSQGLGNGLDDLLG